MSNRPRLSVIVPVFEQWELIESLLDRLRCQTLSRTQFELILVADGPFPVAPFRGMTVITSRGIGAYAARNTGALAATGDWLVFTDADCAPLPDWLSLLDQRARAVGDRAILAGRVVVVPTDPASPSPFETYEMIRGIPQHLYVKRGFGATANLAVARGAFAELGGFDGNRFSGGDAEFCRRASALGMRLDYVPEAIVNHPARRTWAALVIKARRIKGGQLRAGPWQRRLLWLLRTIMPPLRAIARFLGSRQYPLSRRLTAVGVQLRLWGVELVETARLLSGGTPERR